MARSELAISLADVLDAQQQLAGIAHHTPVHTSRNIDEQLGRQVFFKCENFQRGGAFKFRGAYNAISRLSDDQRADGVTTTSSGNHAQGVALAARLLGIRAVIGMPSDAPPVKVEATRGYGAEIVFFDRLQVDAEEYAFELARETGMVFIPAFDHPHIIAGQGTAALELLADVSDFDALVVPIGGGSMISGSSTVLRSSRPDVAIFGVVTEGADSVRQSLNQGRRVSTGPPDTIADGIRVRAPGELTFPIIQALVDDVLVVSDDDLRAALRLLLTRTKLLIEPSGALAVAALLRGLIPARYTRVAVVLTGGNVDPATLATLLS